MFESKTPEKCDAKHIAQPKVKNGEDLEVQLVLAFALGLFALLSFCVRLPFYRSGHMIPLLTLLLDFATTMARTLRCSKAPPLTRSRASRVDRLLLRMDAPAMEGHGRTGPACT